MNSKSKSNFLLWFFSVAIVGVLFYIYSPKLLTPDSDIISLLPKSDNSFADESIDILSAEASKEIIFLIQGNSAKQAIQFGIEFKTKIQTAAIFEKLEPLQADAILREGLALYAPYRSMILPEKTRNLLTAKNLPGGLQQSLSLLQSPMSTFYADFISDDPLFNIPLFLQESSLQNKNQIISDGFLLLKDEQHYFFMLNARLNSSPAKKETHEKLMPAIKEAEELLKAKYPEFHLLKSGLVFFIERASVTMQRELTWLGSLSMLGVLLIMLIVFRSFKQVLLSLLSIGVGVLVALTATLMFFPKIHLITLTFGTSLIGVSIDYSTHYFADYLINQKNWSPSDCLKRIAGGVTWGAFTTILAFIAVAINPLPLLHQIALFSVAGVVGAYLTVIVAFPILLTGKEKQKAPYPFISNIFKFLYIYPRYISKGKNIFWVLFIGMICCLYFVKTEDSLKSLHTPPPDLMQNEKNIHQLLDKIDPSRFILLRADSVDELLQKEESIKPLLSELIKKGNIAQYIATSRFLPSQALQSKNYQLLNQAIQKKDTNYSEDEKNIFDPTNFATAYHTNAEPAKLTPEIFFKNSFGSKFSNLFHYKESKPFSIILLQSVTSDQELTSAFKNSKDIFYINKTAQIAETLKVIREKVVLSTILVYLFIFLLLAFKHGLKKSLAIIAVPAFSATASIILVASFGQSIHISHTLAVIIVLGTGIDYTIFLAESDKQRNATIIAISLSAITTILSFGLLAFCETEFLKGFGIIILIGVSLSYLLSPIFFVNNSDNNINKTT